MRKGLGNEDLLHKQFASLMKKYEDFNKLNSVWYSYDASGENRALKTGALLKAKGLKPGKSDYEFKIIKKNIAHHIYLEFKTDKGRQSESQKDFEKTCFAANEHYYIVRSVKEAVDVLVEQDILVVN